MKTRLIFHKTNATYYLMIAFILCTVFLLTTMGAMNKGAALAASVFDPLITFFENFLVSTFLIFCAIVVLITIIWRLKHGNQSGFGLLSLILGILLLGIFGPQLIKDVATATGQVGSVLELPKF